MGKEKEEWDWRERKRVKKRKMWEREREREKWEERNNYVKGELEKKGRLGGCVAHQEVTFERTCTLP